MRSAVAGFLGLPVDATMKMASGKSEEASLA
jgi:hypothetical protein